VNFHVNGHWIGFSTPVILFISVFLLEKYSLVILDNKKWKAILTLSFKQETCATNYY
jgi:hypothetical protein